MSTKTINMSAAGGPVNINVTCPDTPQSIVGIVWRYNANQTPDGQAGTFKTHSPEISLGQPGDINGKLFLVETVIINQNDSPPTPYEVLVTLTQDGNVLSSEIPQDGGSGTIGDKDIGCVYQFTLI